MAAGPRGARPATRMAVQAALDGCSALRDHGTVFELVKNRWDLTRDILAVTSAGIGCKRDRFRYGVANCKMEF
jgi:hypothetical protein